MFLILLLQINLQSYDMTFNELYCFSVILPHLGAIAASNKQNSDTIKRSMVSIALLEAYTCLTCCCILYKFTICYYLAIRTLGSTPDAVVVAVS